MTPTELLRALADLEDKARAWAAAEFKNGTAMGGKFTNEEWGRACVVRRRAEIAYCDALVNLRDRIRTALIRMGP